MLANFVAQMYLMAVKPDYPERAFISLMEKRIHQVAREKAMNDPEYASADGKKSSIFERLRDSLTTEKQRSLLDDLEGAYP